MTEPTTNGVVPAVKATQVHKAFGSLHVLKGVDMTVMPGSVTVILGPSGSGKSTFLRCLNLLEIPTEGEIWFDGVNMTDVNVDIDRMRQKMGMVFQHFNLFPHLSVIENITLAPIKVKKKNASDANKKAIELLNIVGLSDKADSYPGQLSGGQKQRIAIARALAMETLCCSPPDNWAGKFPSLSFRPTSSKTVFGSMGFLQICPASSTFSKAVRLGTRL